MVTPARKNSCDEDGPEGKPAATSHNLSYGPGSAAAGTCAGFTLLTPLEMVPAGFQKNVSGVVSSMSFQLLPHSLSLDGATGSVTPLVARFLAGIRGKDGG